MRKVTVLERLLADSEIVGGCLQWQGSTDSKGYGQVQLGERTRTGNRKPSKVHRVGYKLLGGPLPGWMPLDHGCRNHRCWLPGLRHAHPVVPITNIIDNSAGLPAIYLQRSECFYGHDLTAPDAYYYRPDGRGRMCRLCHLERGSGRRGDARPEHYRLANEARRRAERVLEDVPV